MIDNNLINYIKENLSAGYTSQQISDGLISQGYPSQNVKDTINYVQKQKKVNKKITPKLVNNSSKIENIPQKENHPKSATQPSTQKTGTNNVENKGNPEPKENFLKNILSKVKKVDKKIWIIAGVSLAVILIIILLIFMWPHSISSDDLSQGVNFNLKEGKDIDFGLDGLKHNIMVDSVNSDSVDITIQSSPIRINLEVGEEKKIDLDKDGEYVDLLISLEGINNGIPNFYIKEINELICEEDWDCSDWSECPRDEVQTRDCEDLNDCGTTKEKPDEERDCNYVCVENWTCTNWTDCVNETQNRTCIDENDCETELNKPNETQDCEMPLECSLKTNTAVISLLSEGVNSSAKVSDFTNATKINWIIENESVISLNSTTGDIILIQPLNVGVTNLTAIDNSIGSECNVTILINITETF